MNAALRSLLRRALGNDLALFEVVEIADDALAVTPKREVLGIGNRVVEPGLFPEEGGASSALVLMGRDGPVPRYWSFVTENVTGPGCHAGMEAARAFARSTLTTAIVVGRVRGYRDEMFEAARKARALAASDGSGLVDGLRRRP